LDNRQKTKRLLKRLRFWPPFLGAGIHVTRVADDFLTIDVELRMKFFNRNYVGTHFGGSLYSMCDPWFMVMLIEQLGPGYIVWDKAASIRFKKPGRGVVKASFHIPKDRLAEIRSQADALGRIEPQFQAVVTDAEGNIVAEVDKLLYVRKKKDVST
jgi:acyl-coenzyme A thioesterase PaaI-like protein